MGLAFKCDLCNEYYEGFGQPVGNSGSVRLENIAIRHKEKTFWLHLDLCLREHASDNIELCDNCVKEVSIVIKKFMLEKLKKEF